MNELFQNIGVGAIVTIIGGLLWIFRGKLGSFIGNNDSGRGRDVELDTGIRDGLGELKSDNIKSNKLNAGEGESISAERNRLEAERKSQSEERDRLEQERARLDRERSNYAELRRNNKSSREKVSRLKAILQGAKKRRMDKRHNSWY